MAKNALADQFAREGEVFLGNSTIRDDGPTDRNTAAKEEAYLRKYYPDYELRFDYKHVCWWNKEMTSLEFGENTTDLPFGHARGVAVYGRLRDQQPTS